MAPVALKTNSLGLGLLMANLGVEMGLSRHLSFHVPVYYSGVDYFSESEKFRTLALQPELRWNFGRPRGLFIGAHATAAFFNVAVGGDYRYQDRGGDYGKVNRSVNEFLYEYAFAGTFDGNGQTISNLNVKSYCDDAEYATAGLFNAIQTGAYIKNITVDTAVVNSSHYAGVIVGHANSSTSSVCGNTVGANVKLVVDNNT